MNLFTHTDMGRSAKLSDCGRYRYELVRTWMPAPKRLGWIMLNPSTADAMQDDATIRKCMKFAKTWGFDGIVVQNLFTLRATNPEDLVPPNLGGGDLLDRAAGILMHAGICKDFSAVLACDQIMAAWGSHSVVSATRADVIARREAATKKKPLYCLAINADGQPRHPLYVADKAMPIVWFSCRESK